MPINISVKNAPDDLATRLKERARANRRSLQGEILAILEQAVGQSRVEDRASYSTFEKTRTMGYRDELESRMSRMSVREVLEHMRRLDVHTGGESAAEIVRRARDTGQLPEPKGKLTVHEISERAGKLGLTSVDEAARLVREDRDR